MIFPLNFHSSMLYTFQGKNGNTEEVRMFNCDHCQKKYKRSWHQARHSQMKHENSNASTATTSSAGTPPTPEINGNVPNNNNFNYQHQLQQVPQMPSQPVVQDITAQHQMLHQQQNVPIPQTSNSWDHQMTHPQHVGYGTANEIVNDVPPMPQQQPPLEVANNGEYVNYAVNEQYSNKFEQVQTTPPIATPAPSSYDSWVICFLLIINLMFNFFVSSRTINSNNQLHRLGITISTIKCSKCIPTSHRHNRSQTSGITTQMFTINSSNKRHMQCITTRTITIKLTSIALIINHQHQFTIIRTRIHRYTTTASITTIIPKIQRPIHTPPALLLRLLNCSSSNK
jgi:hypothetical protein